MKANSYGDLVCIKLSIQSLSRPAQLYLLSRVYTLGLMKTDWLTRTCIKLLRMMTKDTASAWLLFFYYEKTGVIEKARMDSFISHLLDGVDSVDADSKGGFCQSEIDLIWMVVKAAQELEEHMKG